jgi:hypothetical protein
MEEQGTASHEGFNIGNIGQLGKVRRQSLSQYVYVLTLRARPFNEWLCPYIQSRHFLYIDLPHKINGIGQIKQENRSISEQK